MDKRELLRIAMSRGEYPKELFKYTSFNEYSEDVFKNSQMWFPSPYEFNDPFEFQIADKGRYTEDDIFDYLVKAGMSEEDARKLSAQYASKPTDLDKFIENAKRKVFEKYGILCLSKIRSNILMWSHYAKNHTGYVLGFDMSRDIDFYMMPFKVAYQEEYPAIAYLKEKEKVVESSVKTKFKQWDYEQEVRILKSSHGLHEFKKDALRSITFGCKTKRCDEENVRAWSLNYGYDHIKFYKTELSKTAYKVIVSEI